ncbi:MAG TPA: MmcQ/YjbR family DNA-binding protein [Myxococcales bacterium]|nr:MmcQ/YjbR family DNA-binding protein [Myxococcales bacterium]
MRAAAAWRALKKHAAAKPGAWEDHPWGETVFKIGKKVFVFLGHADDGYGMSCKLPHSSEAAITMFGWAGPTGYGLGEAGWVSASFAASEDVPVDLLRQWIDESFAAVAPKRAATPPAAKPAGRRARRAGRAARSRSRS